MNSGENRGLSSMGLRTAALLAPWDPLVPLGTAVWTEVSMLRIFRVMGTGKGSERETLEVFLRSYDLCEVRRVV